jgi:Co/Zn/Cd efflux system component
MIGSAGVVVAGGNHIITSSSPFDSIFGIAIMVVIIIVIIFLILSLFVNDED